MHKSASSEQSSDQKVALEPVQPAMEHPRSLPSHSFNDAFELWISDLCERDCAVESSLHQEDPLVILYLGLRDTATGCVPFRSRYQLTSELLPETND